MVGVRATTAAVTAKAMAVFRNIDLSPPEAIHRPRCCLPVAEAKLNIGSRMREVDTVRVSHACFRGRRQAGVSK
jgi:hypothetical protein